MHNNSTSFSDAPLGGYSRSDGSIYGVDQTDNNRKGGNGSVDKAAAKIIVPLGLLAWVAMIVYFIL